MTATPPPIASAMGNSVPGPVSASTAHMATMAPAARLAPATIASRGALRFPSPTKTPVIKSNPPVNATARPEFKNHGGYSPPGWNHSRQPAVRTTCAAMNTAAPSATLLHRNMSAALLKAPTIRLRQTNRRDAKESVLYAVQRSFMTAREEAVDDPGVAVVAAPA